MVIFDHFGSHFGAFVGILDDYCLTHFEPFVNNKNHEYILTYRGVCLCVCVCVCALPHVCTGQVITEVSPENSLQARGYCQHNSAHHQPNSAASAIHSGLL